MVTTDINFDTQMAIWWGFCASSNTRPLYYILTLQFKNSYIMINELPSTPPKIPSNSFSIQDGRWEVLFFSSKKHIVLLTCVSCSHHLLIYQFSNSASSTHYYVRLQKFQATKAMMAFTRKTWCMTHTNSRRTQNWMKISMSYSIAWWKFQIKHPYRLKRKPSTTVHLLYLQLGFSLSSTDFPLSIQWKMKFTLWT